MSSASYPGVASEPLRTDIPEKALYSTGSLTITANGDTATSNLLPQQNVLRARSATVYLDVTALAGTSPTITFSVDILMPDGTTWVNMHVFTAITAPGIVSYVIGQSGNTLANIGTDLRVRWTSVTGTITATVFVIAES